MTLSAESMIAPFVNRQISSAIAMDIRPPSMQEDAQILRFAIGIFYDSTRLLDALAGFWQLGLTANDIWLGGKQDVLESFSPSLSGNGELKMLLGKVAVIGKLRGQASLCATEGPVTHLLQNYATPDNDFCIESLFKSDMGIILQDHVEKGAIVVATKTHIPAQQDACIRILLRSSLDKVYSQECRLRLSPVIKARS